MLFSSVPWNIVYNWNAWHYIFILHSDWLFAPSSQQLTPAPSPWPQPQNIIARARARETLFLGARAPEQLLVLVPTFTARQETTTATASLVRGRKKWMVPHLKNGGCQYQSGLQDHVPGCLTWIAYIQLLLNCFHGSHASPGVIWWNLLLVARSRGTFWRQRGQSGNFHQFVVYSRRNTQRVREDSTAQQLRYIKAVFPGFLS